MTALSPIDHLKALSHEILEVSWTLYKIMIPTLIVIKVLEELGGIELLSQLLAPLMTSLGLAEAMALVWATSLLTNIYAGMLVFFIHSDGAMTVAQVSVIGGMMLIGHALPIEVRVAQQAGVRLGFSLLLRLLGSLAYGYFLYGAYSLTDSLQEPALLVWQPTLAAQPTLLGWAFAQLQGLVAIFLVIVVLLAVLRLFKLIGIERLINILLAPLLRLFGISRQATSITLVGLTLGLSFGGGLLIREAASGRIKPMDVFAALTLLGLSHSLIEDTVLILLMGADLSAVLSLRLLFTLLVAWPLIYWARGRSAAFQQRYLVHTLGHEPSVAEVRPSG
ncbi:hypothetical protein [Reinekea sp.]|jgi:hypothetical protein|uniref:hypothetical protein n=1 Tax=Reinekea sp. TaxID=1970455 RepID=UPI002A807D87|nr:hypothetical protein [Reinekea sp.]